MKIEIVLMGNVITVVHMANTVLIIVVLGAKLKILTLLVLKQRGVKRLRRVKVGV